MPDVVLERSAQRGRLQRQRRHDVPARSRLRRGRHVRRPRATPRRPTRARSAATTTSSIPTSSRSTARAARASRRTSRTRGARHAQRRLGGTQRSTWRTSRACRAATDRSSRTRRSPAGRSAEPGRGRDPLLEPLRLEPEPFQITDCPAGITPGVTSVDAAMHGTAIGKAFHITTTAPVVAYDIFPYGGGRARRRARRCSSRRARGTRTTSRSTRSRRTRPCRTRSPSSRSPPRRTEHARDDPPTAAIVGGTASPRSPRTRTGTYTLNAGQYLQLTQDAELTGTPIHSDKPIGVWGGATCLNIDVSDTACDSAHQQLSPVTALGHEYAACATAIATAPRRARTSSCRGASSARSTARRSRTSRRRRAARRSRSTSGRSPSSGPRRRSS